MCHDIGKVKEISAFPVNDYTDDGQLLGHIVMGAQMVGERAAKIDGFPHNLLAELQHCILAHHGKLEYGSPKVPALIEAVALNYADDTDAKMETFKEILENNSENSGWLGYNRLFDPICVLPNGVNDNSSMNRQESEEAYGNQCMCKICRCKRSSGRSV